MYDVDLRVNDLSSSSLISKPIGGISNSNFLPSYTIVIWKQLGWCVELPKTSKLLLIYLSPT